MTLLLICFVVFLFLGMPIAFVIGIAGMMFLLVNPEIPNTTIVQRIVAQSQSFTFLAVPFFIFAGNLMNVSGITDKLLGLARLLTRRMYGGTAQISVVMSTLMGGVSGSATADAAMETRILGPEMLKRGYSKGYICAVNCLTALITATIPPSLGLIIFGFVGDVSIGRLFAAGIIPGFLMMAFLMATTSITSRIKRYDPPKSKEEMRIVRTPEADSLTKKKLFSGGKGLIITAAALFLLPALLDLINDVPFAGYNFISGWKAHGAVINAQLIFAGIGVLVILSSFFFKRLPLGVQDLLENLTDSIWALLFPVILILGIRFGWFTPSESGAFAVVYAIVIGKFVYKELTWQKFLDSLKTSFRDNGAIMLIIALSGPFSYAITYVKLPVMLSDFIFGISNNPQILTMVMLAFLFITGMFVDSNVNFLLLTPIFLPMITSLGMDPVHFGVLMATICTLGVMTPPVGSALYTVCGILGCPPEEYTKASLPFLAAIFLELCILVFVPQLVLWIPNMIFGAY